MAYKCLLDYAAPQADTLFIMGFVFQQLNIQRHKTPDLMEIYGSSANRDIQLRITPGDRVLYSQYPCIAIMLLPQSSIN